MSLLPPPPSSAWPDLPPVWWRWFQALFLRVGGSPSATLAPLSSPTFTGTPAVPTAAPGTSSTQAASTEFVMSHAAHPGTVAAFAGASAPTGWLLCDGSAVSRTTFAALFAAIGTTYGTGDGSTTFNIPDGRGRSLIGAGQGSGLTNRALAATGGEEAHALTTAELASHAHAITDAGHVHQVASRLGDTTTDTPSVNRFMSNSPADASTNAVVTNSVSATTGIVVNDAGSGTAHENMPPFLALNWIVKT